jgi:hypothetical protein
MNPISEYFLNVIKIQKDNKNSDEKNILKKIYYSKN